MERDPEAKSDEAPATPRPVELQAGERLGRYIIVDRIGAGDRFVAQRVFSLGVPVVIALNKIDRLKHGHVAAQMKAAASLGARNASTGRISNVPFGLAAKSSGSADVTRCRIAP